MTSPRRGKASHLTAYLAAPIVVAIMIPGMTVSLTTNVTADIARITRIMDGGDMILG